jgi:hypothetical protein
MPRATLIGDKSTLRVELDKKVVAEATYLASIATDSQRVRDYADIKQRYLVLRQRGHKVGWFVRAKRRMKWIGNANKQVGDPSFLNLHNARRKAGEQYYAMKPAAGLNRSGASDWIWPILAREYLAYLGQRRYVGQRIKPPSAGTQNDVRLCFGKPEFAAWQKVKIRELTPWHLIKLLDDVDAAYGHRTAEKIAAYVKAALNWALSQKAIKSGLTGTMPWWNTLQAPQPTEPEIDQIEARQQDLLAAKEACTVEFLGEVLAKHEQYCAGREANKRISPGIRWGLWWVALTANRRFTTTKLRRADLRPEDPRNPYASPDQPWGIAEWPADALKNKLPFMLPIPPIGLHIANASQRDWHYLLGKKRGFKSATQWVFASSRRPRPKDENSAIEDPSIYPNSLNAHIRALRGRKKSGSNKIDYLEGKPEIWPQLVRSAMTNYLEQHRESLHPAAKSAMLGHVLPNDNELDWLRVSKTTEKYYLTYQHMDLKVPAMKQWSEALLQAYVNAGGTLPMPYERPDWSLPKLPAKELTHPRRRAGDRPRRGQRDRATEHRPGRKRPRRAA